MKSVTREINSYYIKDVRNNNCYRIIDTPGFGDTEGYDQDLKNV
jgi:GTP-binding protein EngB required for normal cell division